MAKDIKNKVMAVLGGAVLLGAGLAGGFALDNPATIEKVVEVPVDRVVYQDKIVIKEVPSAPIIKTETVEKVVEDESFVQLLCDRMVYDDIAECKEEVKAEDYALKLALYTLEDERLVFDMLEDEGIVADEDEVSIVKVYSDFEDIEIVESNFEKEEYEFAIKMKIKDDEADEKKYVIFNVEVSDGEVEVTDVTLEE